MVRRRCVSFASIAQVAFVLATAAVAACSSPANLSGFSKADKDENGTDPSGTFENGENNGGPAGPTAGCVPSKGQYDIPGDKCDNDDDGTVDNPPVCDAALTNDGSAEDFARAMGICQSVQKEGFGLVSAKFTRGHARDDAPQAAQHGVLDKFGTVLKPREGQRLGVLSTGFAQEFNGAPGVAFGGNAGGKDWFGAGLGGNGGNGTAPPGYPKAAAGCPQATGVNDVISLKLELKAPKNATGIKFDFNFHSGEWPAFICSEFNDGFIAYLSAQGFNGGKPDNISFDSKKNPVSVNNGFFDRCTANARIGCLADNPSTSTCPAGAEELAGTGFGILGTYCPGGGQTVSGGATGWLSSQAPVKAGETFTLELMIWDTGDGDLDSSVLLDNFQWIGGEVVTQTERPGPR